MKIIRISSFLDLKGVYTLEDRTDNNSKRPEMLFATRKHEIIQEIENFFNRYNIKYNLIIRINHMNSKMYIIKVSGKKRMIQYFRIFEDYFTTNSESRKKVYDYVHS